jgi:hypothetical protein
MPESLVLYDADEEVSIITLNRPEKLNAISALFQPRASGRPIRKPRMTRRKGGRQTRRIKITIQGPGARSA